MMITKIKPYNPSASEFESGWHVLDAKGKVLGRLATEAAMLLMGKHRPGYVPHMLSGDFVVIVNASEVTVTGNKAEQIVYKRHSQKPGNLKEIPFNRVRERFPERVIEHAVRGMLPKNKLGERMIRRLKVYAGEEHPHASQITWTERRPEREAAAAEKTAEEARNRAERRRQAAARRDIAAEAAAKAAPTGTEAEKPAAEETDTKKTTRGRAAAKAEAPEGTAAVAEPEVSEASEGDKAEKKPATRRRSPSRSSSSKPEGSSSTRRRSTSSATKSAGGRPGTSRSRSSSSSKPASSSGAKRPTIRRRSSDSKGK